MLGDESNVDRQDQAYVGAVEASDCKVYKACHLNFTRLWTGSQCS